MTAEDSRNGLNDIRPHVVHFPRHVGDVALLFDSASIEAPQGAARPLRPPRAGLGIDQHPTRTAGAQRMRRPQRRQRLLDSMAVVFADSRPTPLTPGVDEIGAVV